jgi:hypothetical protein
MIGPMMPGGGQTPGIIDNPGFFDENGNPIELDEDGNPIVYTEETPETTPSPSTPTPVDLDGSAGNYYWDMQTIIKKVTESIDDKK